MIHATLQIQTDFHYSLRGKILVIVKDSSGKPIFLCSLAPKKKNAPSYTTPHSHGAGYTRGALTNRVTTILNASDTKKQKNPVHSAQLLGFKLGQACISKGIQSVDVVIQEHSGPTSLLLQGLRMGGVRFNRFRIFNAADRSEDLKSPILDRRTEQLAKHNQAIARLLTRRTNEPKKSFFGFTRIYPAAARRANSAIPRSGKGKARTKFRTKFPIPLLGGSLRPLPPIPLGGVRSPQGGGWTGGAPTLLPPTKLEQLDSKKHILKFLTILTKSRLIKRSTKMAPKLNARAAHHQLKQARALKFKINKILYRKRRRKAIRKNQLIFLRGARRGVAGLAPGSSWGATKKGADSFLRGGRSPHLAPKKEPFHFTTTTPLGGVSYPQGGRWVRGWLHSLKKTSLGGSLHALFPLRVTSPFTQKKAITPLNTSQPRSKKQNLLQLTPSYHLRRSLAALVSTSIQLPGAGKRVKPKKDFFGVQGSKRQVQQKVVGVMPQQRIPDTKTKKLSLSNKARHLNSKRRKLWKARAQQLQTQYIANIQNTLNNTIITITNRYGNTKLWCSSGSIGLKASRRSTNYAAQSVAEAVAKKCRRLGIRRVEVKVQGVGYGKPSALKGLRIGGLKIKRIIDTTPKAHNGCRAPKKRRV